MSTPTIPAAHLIALGWRDGDPPVVPENRIAVSWWQTQHGWHGWHPDAMLLVEQSMPTLLRCLARKYGAELKPGEVPGWRKRDGWWYLAASGMSTARVFVPHPLPPPLVEPDAVLFFHVPALTKGMGRLEALAAVIAWSR